LALEKNVLIYVQLSMEVLRCLKILFLSLMKYAVKCIVKMSRHFEGINLLQAMEFVVNDNVLLTTSVTIDLALQRIDFS
jgi:hypothetical protein